MSSRFSDKTKADLVAIARITGLLKTTVSQKMSKAELLEFLEKADREQRLALDAAPEERLSAPEDQKSETNDSISANEGPKTAPGDSKGADENPETVPNSSIVADKKSEDKGKGEKEKQAEKKAENLKKADPQKPKAPNKRKKSKTAPRNENESESGKNSEEPERTKAHRQRRERKNESGEETKTDNTPEQREQEIGAGILEIMPEGYGFLRTDNYIQHPNDFYLPAQYIRRFNLRNGDYVSGPFRQQRDSDRYRALYYIKEVNGLPPDKITHRPNFERLTPIYPNERYRLETDRHEMSTRMIDLIAPIGKGQRGMIVSPPKAGKTILLQKIANAISTNNPSAKLIVLLIDERPEEVTDMQRSIRGEVVYSTFDKTPEHHVKITELVLERAMRLVELGQDVVILLDSITRMGRAYNLTINPTGRTLSGGLDPGALYGPKRFFGAARNIENGGSLTIIATALVETGSRMDEVIFEEFKGTGNMEVCLDRKLAEKRIFPAIDVLRSGTRREELLLSSEELSAVWGVRKTFAQLDNAAVTESLLSLMQKSSSNEQFTRSLNFSFNDPKLSEAMRASLSLKQKPIR